MRIARTTRLAALALAAAWIPATPSLAYKESLQPNGQRFELLSELNSLGEDKPLLLRSCGVGGPSQVEVKSIRQYYDRSSGVHLWIVATAARKDILFYSTDGFACTVEQQ